jgi:hypothetical protein
MFYINQYKGDNMEDKCDTFGKLLISCGKLSELDGEEMIGLISSTPEVFMPIIYNEVSRRISEG